LDVAKKQAYFSQKTKKGIYSSTTSLRNDRGGKVDTSFEQNIMKSSYIDVSNQSVNSNIYNQGLERNMSSLNIYQEDSFLDAGF
jgi:hypothetical protein